jgi:hypothetical protein
MRQRLCTSIIVWPQWRKDHTLINNIVKINDSCALHSSIGTESGEVPGNPVVITMSRQRF